MESEWRSESGVEREEERERVPWALSGIAPHRRRSRSLKEEAKQGKDEREEVRVEWRGGREERGEGEVEW